MFLASDHWLVLVLAATVLILSFHCRSSLPEPTHCSHSVTQELTTSAKGGRWITPIYPHFTGRRFHCDGKIGPDRREAPWIAVQMGYEQHECSRSASKCHERLQVSLLLTLLKTAPGTGALRGSDKKRHSSAVQNPLS